MTVLDMATGGVTFQDVEVLVTAVVAEVAPGELEILPHASEDFRRDPGALLRAARREPVAMGVDFTPLAATAWLIGGTLGSILVDVAKGALSDALSEPTRQVLEALFGRRAHGRHAMAPDQNALVDLTRSRSSDAFADLVAPSGAAGAPAASDASGSRPDPELEVTAIRLQPEQEAEIRSYIGALTQDSGLDAGDVALIVDCFLRLLTTDSTP
jgi:hypothetical protein